MQTPPLPHREKQHHSHHRRNQPQQHINQIHPNRMFHPGDVPIPLRIRMNIHLREYPKHRRPQNEQDSIPRTCPPEFYFWDHVDYACEGG